MTHYTDANTVAPAAQAPTEKAITTQIAHLALAGHAVHKGNCEDFTVWKYGMAKYCQDFSELKAFAKQIGDFS